MKTAVILAAGEGTRIWPFAEIRPKAMIPVANKPIIAHQVEMLEQLGYVNIVIVGGQMSEQIRHYFRGNEMVTIMSTEKPSGTAFSLCAAKDRVAGQDFLVLFGDTLLEQADVERLTGCFEQKGEAAAALLSPLGQLHSQEWISCRLQEGYIQDIMGHPRSGYTHRFCAFAFRADFWPYISANSGIFSQVQVGVMPPLEGYLEMSLVDYMKEGRLVAAVETEGDFSDIDKPWHILQSNRMMVDKWCGRLKENRLAAGASIDPSASINGYVQLGRGSRIGRNVVIEGNLIVDDHTVIENGAIIQGDCVIGSHVYIGNYCQISAGSTVGNHCIIAHCAELDGVIMEKVYLYHYMEFYGIIGNNTDLGAATVCGTLRFDDGDTTHRIKGRKEIPENYANAVFLGDYVRTGVNAILMPGCKVGVYSVVGAGVIVDQDIPNRTLVYTKQEIIRKEWGPEKYGW
jgi:NDP-sugar pyrophosphorylase family protein